MGLNDRDYMREPSAPAKKKVKKVSFIAKLRFFLWRIWQKK